MLLALCMYILYICRPEKSSGGRCKLVFKIEKVYDLHGHTSDDPEVTEVHEDMAAHASNPFEPECYVQMINENLFRVTSYIELSAEEVQDFLLLIEYKMDDAVLAYVRNKKREYAQILKELEEYIFGK